MTDPIDNAVNAPATTTRTGLTVGLSPQQRLELAMRRVDVNNPANIDTGADVQWSHSSAGVPNPFGRGLAAFEPNNVIFDAYAQAKGEADASKAAASAAKPGTVTVPGAPAPTVPMVQANGQVKSMISAAMALAQRRVPYVWGGTTANGVDCSGLIYYAARAAGIQLDGKAWPRLRAVDYGKLGIGVTAQDARPGDLVYFDEPGPANGTDHVGIYIGNGQMIQAPQTGDVVKVSRVGNATSYRRVFDDSAFGQIATPGGGVQAAYGGTAYNPVVGSYSPGTTIPGLQQALGSTITRPAPKPAAGGRVRAI